MRKTFFQRRNALLNPTVLSVGTVVMVVAILLVVWRVLFPGFLLNTFAPVLRAGAALTSQATFMRGGFLDTAELAKERDTLSLQNAALQLENQRLQAKLDDLTQLLGEAPRVAGVLGGVLARPPQSGYDILIVGAGSASGVATGLHAYALGGIPIGEVRSVTENTARITLFSASGEELPVWIGESRTPALLLGRGGGAFVGEVAKSIEIKEGELVYTAGPGAIPFGVVRKVANNPAAPLTTVHVAFSLNIYSLTWVELRP